MRHPGSAALRVSCSQLPPGRRRQRAHAAWCFLRYIAEEAAAAAAEQEPQQSQGAEAGREQQAATGGGGAAPPFGFPTSLVKRIMMVDDEVQRVSADAVRATAKAAELFVQQLAVKALQHAQASKRKNFKAQDVAHMAGRDR